MMAAGFAYFRPESLEEAIMTKARLGDSALYYAGGTEILSLTRSGHYAPTAVIDIKYIAECSERGAKGESLFFGSNLSLSELADDSSFPLLAAAARGVADRTVRNRIRLGANCAGRLPYREALLPFLALGAIAHLAGPGQAGRLERRELGLWSLHDKRLLLGPGELLLGFSIRAEEAALPWFYERSTKGGRVDYPIASLCMVARGETLSAAVSGAFEHPVRAEAKARPLGLSDFPPTRSDQRASAAYRAAMLDLALERAKEALA